MLWININFQKYYFGLGANVNIAVLFFMADNSSMKKIVLEYLICIGNIGPTIMFYFNSF